MSKPSEAVLAHAESYGQYWTPPELARSMAQWAAPRGRWLEPSCGSGILVMALLDAGAACVVAADIDPAMAGTASPHIAHWVGDFLMESIPWAFDGCLMNPPDARSSGRKHVAKALEICPRVVVLHRAALLHGSRNYAAIWSKHTLARVAHLVKRPRFSGPADKGQVAKTDWSVFDILRGKHEHVSVNVEWWK